MTVTRLAETSPDSHIEPSLAISWRRFLYTFCTETLLLMLLTTSATL
jgi:hypothetical protein